MIVSIVFAAGCFWGVVSAESGYTGGNYANKTAWRQRNFCPYCEKF